MSKSVYVRLAEVGDALSLYLLNSEFNGVELSVTEIEKSLKNTNEIVAVAIINDEIVGFACGQYFKSFCYRDLVGEITELYIKEKSRRLGLATKLITSIEEELNKRGVNNIKVLTGQNNEKAIKTYKKSKYILQDDVVLQKKRNEE